MNQSTADFNIGDFVYHLDEPEPYEVVEIANEKLKITQAEFFGSYQLNTSFWATPAQIKKVYGEMK